MKKFISNISLTILLFVILLIACSLTISGFVRKGFLTMKGPFILTTFLSLFLFFIVGLIFGYKTKKRGLFNGLILSLFYVIFLVIYFSISKEKLTLSSSLISASRIILLITGSIIGVNLAQGKLK